jgi:HD-GYP domain-containing protein (c-di-GMP phosphodiesterase class II)
MTAAPVSYAAPRAADLDVDNDALIRRQRERAAAARLQRRVRNASSAAALLFVVGATFAALLVHHGPSMSWPAALAFTAVYVAVARVGFEVGTGWAIPTELVLVPMLFALPLRAVPLVVAAALLAQSLADRRRPSVERLLLLLPGALHTLGPVAVLALLGGLPLRWSAWAVYLLALAAQFALDFAAAAATSGFGLQVPIRQLARFMGWVYLVDASLAPIGLALAFATQGHAWLVALALPLVGLLRHFARERQRRIDHALELSDAYRGTAFLLGDVVEADDAYTGTHSRHVVDLVLAVCDDLGLSPTERRDAEFVALLHDVGKIRIPSSIINKPAALDADERALIETHTIEGQRMLEQVGGLLGAIGRLVRSCHEHWDGAGYPDGLAGRDIPLIARIVCACDAFSAMTTDRPYRVARTEREALDEMLRCAGTQFDPRVVDALVRAVQ